MALDPTPLRWPAAWKDPGMLSLLQASRVRLLLDVPALADPARKAGFTVINPQTPPAGVVITRGLWPGIRVSQSGGDRAAAGPTGEPWVDSNGWRIRVARLRSPAAQIWVDAKPNPSRISTEDYRVAFADAAAHNGRWVINLDDALAAGIAARQPDAMDRWKQILDAADFFSVSTTQPLPDAAVIGVLSVFAGPKVGFTDEVLNNLARTKQQYRPIHAARLTPDTLAGLQGIIYTDPEEPSGPIRKTVLDFVQAGGTLVTGPAWGSLPKGESQRTHPRYTSRAVGKGSIASATAFTDPYLVANDAVVLVSHRHDIVRYFNSGAISPCLAHSTDKKRGTLQTAFYSLRPVEDASVWVKGPWTTARLRGFPKPEPQTVRLEKREGGVELFLPAVSQFAAIELEA